MSSPEFLDSYKRDLSGPDAELTERAFQRVVERRSRRRSSRMLALGVVAIGLAVGGWVLASGATTSPEEQVVANGTEDGPETANGPVGRICGSVPGVAADLGLEMEPISAERVFAEQTAATRDVVPLRLENSSAGPISFTTVSDIDLVVLGTEGEILSTLDPRLTVRLTDIGPGETIEMNGQLPISGCGLDDPQPLGAGTYQVAPMVVVSNPGDGSVLRRGPAFEVTYQP